MAYLVVCRTLKKLEKRLMTRTLVPLCGGREDRLLEKSVRIGISNNHKYFIISYLFLARCRLHI